MKTKSVLKGKIAKSICSVCNTSFTKREDFKEHIDTVKCGGDEKFPCSICNKSYSCSRDLKKHKIHHRKGKKYACETCNAEFNRKFRLNRHYMTSPNGTCKPICSKPYTCDICNMGYYCLDSFKKHKEMHNSTDKKYFCEFCNVQFCTKYNLIRHRNNRNGRCKAPISNALYTCDICIVSFPCLDSLRKHNEVYHPTGKEYVCETCNAKFSTKYGLARHYNKNPYGRCKPPTSSATCDICNKSYSCLSSLKKHKEAHHGTVKKCSESCSIGFTENSSLILHKRNTSGCGSTPFNSASKHVYGIGNSSSTCLVHSNPSKTVSCGNECKKVSEQKVFHLGNNSFLTSEASLPASSFASQIQSGNKVSQSMSIPEHTFKVFVFKNANSIDFSTFVFSKVDAIKNTLCAELELPCSVEAQSGVTDVECFEIEAESEEKVLGAFGNYGTQFIPIMNAQDIDDTVANMLEEAMSKCPT